MNEPTKEQIQWLWEQCGLKCFSGYLYYNRKQVFDVGNRLDLNNLYRYAVSNLINKGYDIDLFTDDGYYFGRVRKTFTYKWLFNTIGYLDPALALFWAIYKAFGGKQCAGLK